MEIIASKLAGCFELKPRIFQDARGLFIKPFAKSLFTELGLETDFVEDFYSVSKQSVARGLHFQVPPRDGAKLVTCLAGRIKDVVVDIRTGSPTYGEYVEFDLDAATANLVYVPRGFAHGFYVPAGEAIVYYKVTSEYDQAADAGILWDSAAVPRPNDAIFSERDKSFPSLRQWQSPFKWNGR